jgi:hypothetical protein
MKTQTPTQLAPCSMFVSTLEKIAFDNSKGGLFKWYVRQHAKSCDGCKDALSALECYKSAVRTAHMEASAEGETLMTSKDVSSLLNQLEQG